MTPEELKTLIAVGYEQGGVEFKPPGSRSDRFLFARVVRAVLGMANRRDGGRVVVGVEDKDRRLTPVGLSANDMATWNYDDVMAGVAPYADPFVELDLEVVPMDRMDFVVLTITEFEEVPVLCAKDYQGVLRQGACYVRSRRKPETAEVPTQSEMRELLELAVEKRLRRFVRQAKVAGLPNSHTPSDDQRFDTQVHDFL